MSKIVTLAQTSRIAAPRDCEHHADRCFYMIQAALDIMENTFNDSKLNEQITGKKNAVYVTPEQIDLIMYLLYECAENADKLRDALST